MEKIRKYLNSCSIKYKIFITFVCFSLVMLSLLWICQVVFMAPIYGNIRMKQLDACTQKIENVIRDNDEYDTITAVAEDSEACVMVINPEGVVVHSADCLKNCRIHKMNYVSVLKILNSTVENGGELKGVYSSGNKFRPDRIFYNTKPDYRSDSPQSMIYCRQVTSRTGEPLAYILLNIQLSPVEATVSTIRVQLIYITVVMIAISAVLAGVLSRNISKPIEKIAGDAQQLATGDYETVFDATGYAEIEQLSATLTRTAEELGRVETMRRDFISNVSHDLRTPLTLIGGYAEVMRDIPGENNSRNAQLIIDETTRLSTLVNDLLDISRIQSGAVPVEFRSFNLTESVQSMVERLQELLRRDGYTITFDYTDKISVVADEVRISQCVYNILINAVNHTGEDKRIIAEQEIYDDMVRISVTDTGSGVSEKDMPYVWERYYKNDNNHRRSVTGTGLGLSIVRSVIKAHSGLYGVYNTKDKGACFWFSLPKNK